MKSMKRLSQSLKFGLLVPLALLGLAAAPHARADVMMVDMVRGNATADFSINATSAGTISAQVTNVAWPLPLSSLSFSLTSANNTLTSWSVPTSQSESFQVTPGTYFAHISATATGLLDTGLFSLALSFNPNAVPLPSSEWMLLIGVLVLFGLTRVVGAFGPRDWFRTGTAA
jgi:hypothetical protein